MADLCASAWFGGVVAWIVYGCLQAGIWRKADHIEPEFSWSDGWGAIAFAALAGACVAGGPSLPMIVGGVVSIGIACLGFWVAYEGGERFLEASG